MGEMACGEEVLRDVWPIVVVKGAKNATCVVVH